jgi:23S rRNA (guanosine2251-2'-O)-methyltransferase
LESERPIHRIWCTPEMRFRPVFLQLLREAKASGVLVEEVSWARLGQISGGAVHQGIVLQPAAADTLDLPSLIDGCRKLGESPLLVAVDGLTDPQNLGAILRSAEALGVHGLVLPQRRNAGLTGSVAKVAAGALEHLPVARVVNLNRSLETLREEGYRVVGLDPLGSVSLEEADLEGPLVVITGSEGQGLSVLTRRSCDQLVRIPLRGSTPSLNASVATALVLYEVARRGWMRGLRGMAKPPRLVRPNVPTEAAEAAPMAPEAQVEAPLEPVFSQPKTPLGLALEDAPSAAETTAEAPSEAMPWEPEPPLPLASESAAPEPEPPSVAAEGGSTADPEPPVEAPPQAAALDPQAAALESLTSAPEAPESAAPAEPEPALPGEGTPPATAATLEAPAAPAPEPIWEEATEPPSEAPAAAATEPPPAEPPPPGPAADAVEAPAEWPAPASFASDIHL